MESFSSENCFICNEYMGPFKSDLTVVTSYSEKPIYQFIQNIANMRLAEEVLMDLGVCQNCFIKLNEYDEYLTKANTIETELLAIMNTRGFSVDEIQEQNPLKIEPYEMSAIQSDDLVETIDFDPYTNDEEIFLNEEQDSTEVDDCLNDSTIIEESSNFHSYEIIVDDAVEDVNKVKLDKKPLITSNLNSSTRTKSQIHDNSSGVFCQVGDQKYYQCDICNKLCKDRSKLKSHREIHTEERNIICPECGKSFKTTNCLRNHRRLHVPRPQFGCDQCDKKYTQKVQLKKHIEIIHMQRRDFTCFSCGASFGTNSVLKMHLLSHQDFRAEKCNICHYRFHTKAKLRRHMKSHTGQRDYECHICSKKFLYSYNVVAHIRNVHEKAEKADKTEKKRYSFSDKNLLGLGRIIHEGNDVIVSDEIVEEELYEYDG